MNSYSGKYIIIRCLFILSLTYTLQALSDANILKNIDRFGGSSTGAYIGLLLALECSTEEIEKILLRNPRTFYGKHFTSFVKSNSIFTYLH